MTHATEKIDLIAKTLEDDILNKKIFHLLQNMREISQSLDYRQKSDTFHNMLRSFNRMWGDEFSPKDETVSPLLDDLFELHGFPDEKSNAK
ncbi:hypothetical protein SAMN04488518_12516 [Pseudovibrio ascidiaceicola]|uniref:Uncharacterized protein n=1 Tax=Pseudovibrio ascidiaceicola TaxID=285279 RepID=A0A1I4G083_9HYPH|nr:hypothetical protein [Pseudovibrio ascidiaceicola]SFL23548.1 hypothetical protein SAMN04488518_12516 [Pseudovibrio ascidiaceicola]